MKSLSKASKFFFGTTFNSFLNFTTLLGFVFLFITNRDQALIALIAFCLFLVALLGRFFWLTENLLKQRHSEGYNKLSTHVLYSTVDGKKITFSLDKYHQCKQAVLKEYDHKFLWSGTNMPLVTSNNWMYKETVVGSNGWATAKFSSQNAILFNSVFLVNICMELDDTDKKSSTHVHMEVDVPMHLISFDIELMHKRRGTGSATLFRKAIGYQGKDVEDIEQVPFDLQKKRYQKSIYNPEPGFIYGVKWDR